MRKITVNLLALLLTGLGSSTVYGQKTGILNMQQVILGVDEGKKERGLLEGEIRAKQSELQEQKAMLDKMNREWKEKAPLLSEQARLKKQQEFQEKFVELRNAEMRFQGEIKRREAQATQKIALKVQKIVEEQAKLRKLDIVHETNSSGILYIKDPVDLTKEVIDTYNERHKVASASSKATKSSNTPPSKMDLTKKENKSTKLN